MSVQASAALPIRPLRGLFLAWLLAGLLACAVQAPRPDLARIYRHAAASPDRTPLILIPGLFGSTLVDAQGRELWPGDWRRLLLSDYPELALRADAHSLRPLPDGLRATGIAESVLGTDYYGPIIETLLRFGGYARVEPGQDPPAGRRALYLFPYDWRQDNVRHAAALDALIEQIRRDHRDPGLKVDLVAHSMGGLIARYYLRYGPEDVLGGEPRLITLYGTERVRKLILLGTPNFGAVSALHGFLRGEKVGLGRIAPQTIASLPSAAQLFPHPLAEWAIDARGALLHEDLYAAATWERLGWGLWDAEVAAGVRRAQGLQGLDLLRRQFERSLERARRLHWMLSTPEPASPIRYVLLGGNCEPTPARVLLEPSAEGGPPRTRLSPDEIAAPRPGLPYADWLLEPGDGRVTKPSLLARETLDPSAPQQEEAVLPIAYYFFLCERHDQLTGNPNFQDNLLNILLTPKLPWE